MHDNEKKELVMYEMWVQESIDNFGNPIVRREKESGWLFTKGMDTREREKKN